MSSHSNNKHYHIGVIGGGAWGTTLAILANRAGSRVTLCTRNSNVIQSIRERRSNEIYLPSVFIDPQIDITDKIADVCRTDALIIAAPSHVLRSACIAISDMLAADVPLVIASKGVERGSLMLMSEVVKDLLPKNPIAILSGPNFADEAARGIPTATTLASHDKSLLEKLVYAIGGKLFRPYLTDDVTGTQIGGAVKNVIAIACGISIGKGFGENTRAMLVTRGFAEMARLAEAKGGKHETLMGLSGLGDLILTCGSAKSRNLSFGIAIGQGKSKEEILGGRGRGATEGVASADSVQRLARKFDVSMPICEAVYRILHENADVDQVIASLLERPFANERL
jgi:glycerol-3-phosphate dehydrogenase (NAD(P)+)